MERFLDYAAEITVWMFIASFGLAVIVSCFYIDDGNCKLEAYKNYYRTTEKILDELDAKYNIADELSSDYYDAVEEINNLK